jgi:rare lipoprotein A
VAGTRYAPADVLNYDEVGYLTLDPETMGYTGAHHTLPVPSYVEVTSLETGRTVLVRLERRGPMNSNHLLALSPAAMAQLGGNVETPVRVRRVNPPEEQRVMLRRSDAAPLRMDTPSSLLTVLRRRLPESGSASLATNVPRPQAIETVEVAASTAMPATQQLLPGDAPAGEGGLAVDALAPAPAALIGEAVAEVAAEQAVPEQASTAMPAPDLVSEAPVEENFVAAFESEMPVEVAEVIETAAVAPEAPSDVAELDETAEAEAVADAPQPVENGFVVQAAAFANPDNARRAANALGGEVSQSGNYYRVRTGPFATRGEAEASLANVRRAGYSDARILTSG